MFAQVVQTEDKLVITYNFIGQHWTGKKATKMARRLQSSRLAWGQHGGAKNPGPVDRRGLVSGLGLCHSAAVCFGVKCLAFLHLKGLYK